ncbi:family 78 glycoside hydrolase catalytic domain [Pelagicoccus sp. SDUM812005]|uniref:family 78 glycoside hydrolase catalytic domain n=1 Tax=Pelagicoccus sp. SDUM812005 TaxID=3041257 RepID=UPI002811D289|nr:family 78 glycoside hydrolase catalytic domain [Pelagicoccus sp. SDUM812005]
MAGCVLCSAIVAAPLRVVGLKSESLVDPIQLDSASPRLAWKLRAESSSDRGRSQSAYRILVASSLERLQANEGDLWDSGRVESSRSTLIAYEGQALASRQACYWKVMVWDESGRASDWSPVASWTMALLEVEDWKGSDWIGLGKDTRTSKLAEREFMFRKNPEMRRSHASPLLRKEVELPKPVKRALAYVSGVGYSEFYVNGQKMGDAVLDPGQTNYEKHTLYVTHDITESLRKGINALGIWLGSGFFGQNVAWEEDFDYGQPRARAKVFVEYEDGTVEEFGTDSSWKATTSPVVFDNVYWGETYDARLEIPDWASVGCDESLWQSAVWLEAPCPTEKLRSQLIPPIRVQRLIEPVEVKDIGGGKYVVDFGENLAGWVEIEVEQEAGDVITIVAGERMEPDGVTVNTGTSGGAPGRIQEMIYVARGDGPERWSPRFAYHGFQYIEISGLRSAPQPGQLKAALVHSDIQKTGRFESSEELLNLQYEITCRTLEANWHSIPEDCPAREKCGWLGDAHATSDISFYGYDIERFLAKFLRDIEDSLRPDARYEQVVGWGDGVPTFVAPGKRTPNWPLAIDWAVAYVILNWDLYLHTGDADVFRRHYQNIKHFVSYFESMRGPGEILPSGLGDWCPPLWDRKSAPEYMYCHPHVSGTAFYYRALQISEKMAGLFGEREYEAYCGKLAEDVKDAFNEAYLVEDAASGSLFYGSQTATVMALKFGMVPEDKIEAVVRGLVRDIEDLHAGHHAVGIHGLRHIYTVLADFGHETLAGKMLLDRTFPGPGYLADYGFTTWPERQFNWDKEPRYRNSMNHPMQGGFAAFFYEGIGGIRPVFDGAGYQTIEFRPRLMAELDWARVSKESPYGTIRSEWRRTEEGLQWVLEIPVNSEAVAYLPTGSLEAVSESGSDLENVSGIRNAEVSTDAMRPSVKLRLGSGQYSFLIED